MTGYCHSLCRACTSSLHFWENPSRAQCVYRGQLSLCFLHTPSYPPSPLSWSCFSQLCMFPTSVPPLSLAFVWPFCWARSRRWYLSARSGCVLAGAMCCHCLVNEVHVPASWQNIWLPELYPLWGCAAEMQPFETSLFRLSKVTETDKRVLEGQTPGQCNHKSLFPSETISRYP